LTKLDKNVDQISAHLNDALKLLSAKCMVFR
jgi:hypothetical protein